MEFKKLTSIGCKNVSIYLDGIGFGIIVGSIVIISDKKLLTFFSISLEI